MRTLVKKLLVVAAIAALTPGVAYASLTRVAGPTAVVTDGRLMDMFDVAFDSGSQVYLAVWGTMNNGPTNGQFLDVNGVPIGGPFRISDGTQQAGWARVVFGGGKFLVSYTKILSATAHQRAAKFVSYQSGAPGFSGEMEIDQWTGGAGSASGMAYSNGRFLVTWWNWNFNPPQSYVTIMNGSGGVLASKVRVTTAGDGQTDPEIACDSARGRCLVVGHQWGVFNPGATPGTWGQMITDDNATLIGGGKTLSYGSIQKEDTVAFSAAGDRFLVTYSRFQNTVLGLTLDNAANTMAEGVLRNAAMSPEGAGYGNPKIVYNPATGSSIVAIMPWTAQTAVVELDSNGGMVGGTFQFIPGVSAANYNSGTKQVATAIDPVNSRFLVGDIQAFLTMRSSVFAANGAVAPPPPPPPTDPVPPPPPPPPTVDPATARERGRSDFNADGNYDIIWRNSTSGNLAAWMLQGTSLKSEMGFTQSMPDPNWRVAGTGDFNKDGKPDILWQHRLYGFVAVWYMNGLTCIGAESLSIPQVDDIGWQIVGVGDIVVDGSPDILWQHTNGTLGLWVMNGKNVVYGVTMTGDPAMADSRWRVNALADMNGDGKIDILWRHSDGWVVAWLMDGTANTQVWSLSPGQVTDTAWQIVGMVDVNKDGKQDIVWQHSSGTVAVWAMNGLNLADAFLIGPGSIGPNWRVVGPK